VDADGSATGDLTVGHAVPGAGELGGDVVVDGGGQQDLLGSGDHLGQGAAALLVEGGEDVVEDEDRLAVPPEQTAAFGDYLNDMEMLQAAGRSFAVADAHPQILAVAQCRIPSCGQDVVDAIGRLLARG